MRTTIDKARDERDQGFTLIELLVVVIIIGILAAIAIPVFLNQRKKGVDASVKSDLKNAAIAVETWATDNPSTAIPAGVHKGTGAPATPAAAASAALAGFNVSPGNVVRILPHATQTGAYCLFGSNAGATDATADGTRQFKYDSYAGGLAAATVAGAPACA